MIDLPREPQSFPGYCGRGSRSRYRLTAPSIPIIDTHIHLFDPRRPQGVPWPDKSDATLYQPALPDRYRSITRGLGVVGAIEVECSPWLEDNQWVLDVAARDTIVVGTVGDLEPGKPGFRGQLERLIATRSRGIRSATLGTEIFLRNCPKQALSPTFGVSRMPVWTLDTANPDPASISAVVRLTDKFPACVIVVDHLPQLEPDRSHGSRGTLGRACGNLKASPGLCQVSGQVLGVSRGQVPADLNFYRPRLDEIWDIFGEDRLLYGSDWPNSDRWGRYSAGAYVHSRVLHGKRPGGCRNSLEEFSCSVSLGEACPKSAPAGRWGDRVTHAECLAITGSWPKGET